MGTVSEFFTANKTLKRFLVAIVLLSVSSFGYCSPELSSYEMVFNDEFNGSSLDQSKWSTSPIWGPFERTNNEQQYYIDKAGLDTDHPVDPFIFDGDTLTIRATLAPPELVPLQPVEDDSVWSNYPEYSYNPDYDSTNRSHFSGLISSVNSFTFTHGYAEARLKVPSGQGLWPAFWQLTNKYVEDAPEIDIMESLGQFPNEVNHTMHYFDTSNNWALISSPTYKTVGPDFTEDFHVYGMMWSPESVAWFVDGVEVQRLDASDFTIPKQAMYIIANLAVGGSWPGAPDDTTPFPADYQIDYIRVYQRKPPERITSSTLTTNYQLMFSDEFSGDVLDETKWNTSFLWGPHQQINNEEQVYVDVLDTHANHSVSPFLVSDGTLKITADNVARADLPAQPSPGSDYWSDHPERQHNAAYDNTWIPGYTSGIITSYDSFKFVHGYVEYRAKLPAGEGLWPAFWLLNGYYVGSIPEIDIMELQGEEPSTVHQSYHYFQPDGTPVSSATTYSLPDSDFSQDFHTFGVKWHPGQIVWYVDGTPVRTLEGPEVSLQLMYLIANLAVGGNFVGAVGQAFPATLEIDYIRAYQLREQPLASPPPPPPLELPGEITPIAPTDSVATESPTFEWEHLSGVEDYVLVVFDRALRTVVHQSRYDSDAICDEIACSVQPANVSLNFSRTHFWRVRARNSRGWNDLSDQILFSYIDAPPGEITAIAPVENAEQANPSFEWLDLGNVDEYDFLVYDRYLREVVYQERHNTESVCNDGVCSVRPDGLALNFSSRHFWRIRARNSAGWSGYSDQILFAFLDELPGEITPIAPTDSVATESPTFEWEHLSGVEDYVLVVFDGALRTVVHQSRYDSDAICDEIACSVQPANVSLNFSRTHFWRIRARNSRGWNELSDQILFSYVEQP